MKFNFNGINWESEKQVFVGTSINLEGRTIRNFCPKFRIAKADGAYKLNTVKQFGMYQTVGYFPTLEEAISKANEL